MKKLFHWHNIHYSLFFKRHYTFIEHYFSVLQIVKIGAKICIPPAEPRLHWIPAWSEHWVDVKGVKPPLDIVNVVSHAFVNGIIRIVHLDDWCKGNKNVYLFYETSLIFSKSQEKLRSALRVPNIRKINLPCSFKNKINHGWQIVHAHFNKAVVKKVVISNVFVGMLLTINVASVISEPHVVTRLKKLKRKAVFIIFDIRFSGWS